MIVKRVRAREYWGGAGSNNTWKSETYGQKRVYRWTGNKDAEEG